MTSTLVPPLDPFGLKRQALMHAKAMLLVNDGEGEVLEDDIGLKQGVRADQNVDLAACKPL